MINSGAWMQHDLACDNLQIKDIRVSNHCNYNNDGIDIDGCHDVIISDCIVDSADDGICLKSTSPRLCRNVIVSNCVVHSRCNSLKLGTETTGGFQNIQFSNCLVSPTENESTSFGQPDGRSAISVEMVDGGILVQVSIDHITILETGCPIFIRLGNRARKYSPEAPQPPLGTLRNVSITNITAATSSNTTSNITGISGAYAENIYLGNIQITNKSKGTSVEVADMVPEKDGRVTEMKAELNKRFDTKEEAYDFLEKCRQAEFKISDVIKKPGRRSPAPPFITSTLQQEASRKLGF